MRSSPGSPWPRKPENEVKLKPDPRFRVDLGWRADKVAEVPLLCLRALPWRLIGGQASA
ncbi:MAG: hypothetical protein H0U00_14205 [Actinobacteria bacterium]|nr:hypothetical protein [Actinomycetota bacterium]